MHKYTFHSCMRAIWEGVDSIGCAAANPLECKFRSGEDGPFRCAVHTILFPRCTGNLVMGVVMGHCVLCSVLTFYDIDRRTGLFAGCLVILIVGFRVLGVMCLVRKASPKKST